MRLYDQTCVALCEGQYIDIATSAVGRPDDRRALLRHDRPQDRGPDLGARSRPARCSPRTTTTVIARYRRFGWALGLAFQLNDDLLGIWGLEQQTGKVPTDVARHKKTLPVLYAFEHATPADRDRLAELYRIADPTEAEVVEIVAILDRAGGQAFTRAEAQRWRDDAASPSWTASTVVDPAARDQLRGIIMGHHRLDTYRCSARAACPSAGATGAPRDVSPRRSSSPFPARPGDATGVPPCSWDSRSTTRP